MEEGKIFISYRREDTSGESGRLKDKLEQVFGKENIFYDVETLEAGLNFDQSISKALNESKVLLAMIGPHWLKAADSNGVKRITKPEDWVRKEISEALKMNLRVIPVLVNGAEMPDSLGLPDDLRELSLKHAQELSSSRWNYDVGELTKVLEKIISKTPTPKETPQNPHSFVPPIPKPKSYWAKNYLWFLGGFVGLVFLVQMCNNLNKNTNQDVVPEEESQTLVAENESDNSVDSELHLPENSDQPLETNSSSTSLEDQRTNNPDGNEIYNSLTLQDAPDFSGKWWIRLEGVRSGYFQITQKGTEFSFVSYYFDSPIGEGLGVYENGVLYSTKYTESGNSDNSFEFTYDQNSNQWVGKIISKAVASTATLSRNAQQN